MPIVLFHVLPLLRYIPPCSVNDRSTIEVVLLTNVTSRCESSGIQRTLSNEFEQSLEKITVLGKTLKMMNVPHPIY